jgi:hypothetical protein
MPFFKVFIKIVKDVIKDEYSIIRNLEDKHRVLEVFHEQLPLFKIAFDLCVEFNDDGDFDFYFSILQDKYEKDPTWPLFCIFEGNEYITTYELEHIGLFVHVGVTLVDTKKSPYEEDNHCTSNRLDMMMGFTKYAKKAKKPNKLGTNSWVAKKSNKWFETKMITELNYID